MARLATAVTVLLLAVAASPAHALAPIGPGGVALWQAEGDAADSLGAHHGTALGGAAFEPASLGQAFSFTGDGQAIDVPDSADLYSSGSFTVAGWARTTQATGTQSIVTHYECGLYCPTGGANSTWGIWVTDGVAEGFVRDVDAGGPVGPPNSEGQDLKGGPLLSDGVAHHVALVRDVGAATLTLYVDGVVASSAPLNDGASGVLSNVDGEADDVYIGAFRRCGPPVPGCDGLLIQPLAGLADDVIYWDRALGEAQLAAIHAAGPDALTTDVTAPESSASAPASAVPGTFTVGFSSSDPQGAAPRVRDPSGAATVDLYAKRPSDAALTKVATAPGAASGSFSYAAATPGTYEFATVATDAAGNAEALPATADARTVVAVPPAPAPKPAPAPQTAPAPVKTVEQVIVGLPSTRRCVSRRSFSIHVRAPRGVKLTSATVFVDGRKVAVRRGRTLTAPVNLKGLPKGRYSVRIVLVLASGKQVSGTRRYRTCAPKRA